MAGLMNMIAGALNIMVGGLWVLSLIWVCIGIFWLVPLGLGVFQVMVGMAMNNGQPKDNAKMATMLGLLASLFNFNLIGLAVGAFAFMNLGKPEVAGWLESNKQLG